MLHINICFCIGRLMYKETFLDDLKRKFHNHSPKCPEFIQNMSGALYLSSLINYRITKPNSLFNSRDISKPIKLTKMHIKVMVSFYNFFFCKNESMLTFLKKMFLDPYWQSSKFMFLIFKRNNMFIDYFLYNFLG